MKREMRASAFFALSLCLLLSCRGSTSLPLMAQEMAPQTTLVLGLYPYVPRFDQFESTIQEAWAKVEPSVGLQVLTPEQWDGGYSMNPPDNVDVYVFDALFFDYFRSQSWLEGMAASEVNGLDDYLDYAISGVQAGGFYYSIPLLGCANILFYRSDDVQLAQATTLDEVHQALGQCQYRSQIPPNPQGLMVDLAGGTTTASFYVDTVQSVTDKYPVNLPWNRSEVNPAAMTNLREVLAMASYWNGTKDTDAYQRAAWFSKGHGRAVVGFTEALSAMDATTRANVSFKVMPLADTHSRPLFYADVIGVHPNTVKRGTRALAVKLANLLASTENVVASFQADASGTPQYLMATRKSVFEQLEQSYPLYRQMYQLVATSDPILFGLSGQSRDWLNAMKGTLKEMVRENNACGCDILAGPIWNQGDAETKCPGVCQPYNGWSGQWVTTVPAEESVCGCNSCPAPSG